MRWCSFCFSFFTPVSFVNDSEDEFRHLCQNSVKNNEISIETITERLQEVTQLSEELDQALQSAQQDCIVFSIHPLEKEVNNNCVDLEEKSDRCFGVMDRNLSEVCSQLKTYFTKTTKFVYSFPENEQNRRSTALWWRVSHCLGHDFATLQVVFVQHSLRVRTALCLMVATWTWGRQR